MPDIEDEKLLELADYYRALVKSPGWDSLKISMQIRTDEFVQLLATPSHLRDANARQPTDDYLRGAIFGLQFCFAYPHTIMEQAQAIAERAVEDEKDTE